MVKNNRIRYPRRVIFLHWLHTAAFLVLFLTGLARFLQQEPSPIFHPLGIVHRIAAVIFACFPLIYYFIWPTEVTRFIKGLFQWNKSDLVWLKKAPGYYFGSPGEIMPLQNRINPLKRAWEVATVVTGLISVATGIPLWFFKYLISVSTYQWLLAAHAATFVIIGIFFILHTYLEVFHPRFNKALRSMLRVPKAYRG